MNAVIEARFTDPVRDSQRTFRALMEAMARPGRPQPLGFDGRPPPPLTEELAATALTLADQDTPVWLDTALGAAPAVREWLAFQTGAPITPDPQQAVFALVSAPHLLPAFSRFASGTDEYPDRSTTVVLQLDSFEGGRELRLAGPGMSGARAIAPAGLPTDFVDQWAGNRVLFPRGVDLLLVSPGTVMGLPRSTRVEV